MTSTAIDWPSVRRLFPACDDGAYLMTAAMAPLPTPVLQAVTAAYGRLSREGGRMFHDNLALIERCRGRIAALIGAAPDEVAFIPNVSFGMNALALSLSDDSRTRGVAILADEFPSGTLPWRHAGWPVVQVQPAGRRYPTAHVLGQLRPQPAALVASHVQYATGARIDLQALGPALRQRDVRFVVNATQSIGVLPIDVGVARVDALVATCHKWLFTSEGICVLYLSTELRERLRPALLGWRSVARPMEMAGSDPEQAAGARVFELGTPNAMAFHALNAALDLVDRLGVASIGARVEALARTAIQRLQALDLRTSPESPQDAVGGIVSFQPEGDPDALVADLRQRRVFVTRRGPLIRLAFHFFNDESNLDRLIEALSQPRRALETGGHRVAAS